MRKVLISFAVAGAALAAAAPAAAQYHRQPQVQPYSYGQQSYGYNGNGQYGYGQVRALQARIDNLQRQLRRLDRGHGNGGYGNRDGNFDRLRDEARNIERRLRNSSRRGLNPYEANDIQSRLARLEQQVSHGIGNGYSRGGYGNGYENHGRGNDDHGYSNRGDDDHDRDHDRDDDDDN